VAESFQEVEFFFDTGGEIADKLFPRVGWDQFRSPCVRKTPVEYLHDMGFMRCAPSMVHCVQVSDADIDRIVASQAQVVLCPRSNFYLGVGSAPWERFLEKNVILALGTDSLASNQSLSMWDEMRFLMEAAGDTLNPLQVLYMATMGSAKALGMEKEIGSLEEGKMADLVAIRLKENDLTQNSIFGHLVEHTFDPDIEMVMVGGNVCSGKKPAEISS
jgi:cytosine/adenosine deaminase-related metal-dependent hydrolase